MAKVEVIESQDLNHVRLAELRFLLEAAFPNQFSDSDWEHTMGGHHIVLTIDGAMASHAAVVERTLHAAGRSIRTGYVESVATLPQFQNGGHGSNVMRTTTGFIRGEYDFGALSTGSGDFYESFGWERWQGLTYARGDGRLRRTPDDDDSLMVLRFGSTARLDLRSPISCEDRNGDAW